MARGTLFSGLMAFCLAIGLLSPLLAEGQSYRYGTVSWEQLSGVNVGRTVKFTIRTAWQSSAFGGSVAVGSTQSESTQFFPSSISTSDKYSFSISVTFVSSAGTWFLGEQTITYSYSVDGFYYAYFERCCRLSGLINNAGLNFRLETYLRVFQGATRQSASVTIAPIVTTTVNSPLVYQITASSPNGNSLRYLLAESVANSVVVGTTSQASFTAISGLSLNQLTGAFTWTPTTQGTYQQQIYVDEYSGTTLFGRTAVDFLFSVIASSSMRCKAFCANKGDPCASSDTCSNCFDPYPTLGAAPLCDINYAPTFTQIVVTASETNTYTNPSGTYTASVIVGNSVTVVVTATDQDVEDRVTISSTTLTGATLTPVVGRPGTLTLSYTLSSAVSPIVCFTATDSVGQQSSSQLCVLINPIAPTMTVVGPYVTYPAAGINGFSVLSAGEAAAFVIQHDTGKTISVSINGVSTATATVTVTSTNAATQKSNYTASYNSDSAIQKSGSYTVTVTETTVGTSTRSSPIVRALQVYATTTARLFAAVFEQGSTGLTGGVKGGSLNFFIQSKDRFGNNVLEDRSATESYLASISYSNGSSTITVNYTSTYDSSTSRYKIQYTVPSPPDTVTTYDVRVYYFKSGVNQGQVGNSVYTCTIVTGGNVITTPDLLGTYTAGEDINFTIYSAVANEPYTVTIAGMEANVTALGYSNSASKYLYKVFLIGGVTLAKFYDDASGVIIVSPNLIAPPVNGIYQYRQGFTIIPARTHGPSCVVSGSGIGSAIAGKSSYVEIIPYDKFGNRVEDRLYNEVFSWSIDHESALDLSGTADYDDKKYIYTFVYTFTKIGQITLTISLDGTGVAGEAAQGSPFVSRVTAADVSVSASAIASPSVVTVGTYASLSVTALDVYFNNRVPGQDTFESYVTVDEVSTDLNTTASSTVNDYFTSYTTTKSGFYDFGFKVFSSTQGGFINFPTRSVYFKAGAIDPTKNSYSGKGLAGGLANTRQQLLIQCRDQYENVVEEQGGVYVLVVVKATSEPTKKYLSSYRQKIGCGSASTSGSYRFSTLQNDNNGANTVTVEEQALQTQGYFEIEYKVPKLGSQSNSLQYNMIVYNVPESLLNTSEVNYNPDKVPLDQLTISNTLTATASRNAALTAVTDEWYVVAAIVLASLMGLSIALYAVWRMVRYREKYHEEKVVADELQKQVRDMADEQDLIPGQRDYEAIGEATVTLNPLHAAYRNSVKTVPKEAVDDAEIEMDVERSPLRQEFKPHLPSGAGSSLE